MAVNNLPSSTTAPTSIQNLFGSDFQDDLSSDYRTPLSVAVGAEVKPWAPLTVGLTVEYSVALGRQALLDAGEGALFRDQGRKGA